MTPAEFHHLIETRRISLEWALDWRASIAQPYTFAWGPTALAAGPLPLFETQEGES